ncbi:hypothetical protein FRC19_005413, partial [Serendipita sp. 401]
VCTIDIHFSLHRNSGPVELLQKIIESAATYGAKRANIGRGTETSSHHFRLFSDRTPEHKDTEKYVG